MNGVVLPRVLQLSLALALLAGTAGRMYSQNSGVGGVTTTVPGAGTMGTPAATTATPNEVVPPVNAPALTFAAVAVDAATAVRTVDERVFGVNTAVWDGHFNDSSTLPLVQAAGIRTLRFPGGSTADVYDWKTQKNTQDGSSFANWGVSFDQFAAAARTLQAQVFITVNYGSGTPQDAADWVKYSNVTKGYGFKYWEIGNENYGSWENDTHASQWDPVTYATVAADFMAKMRAVDPTIKIGVVAEPGEDTLDAKSPVHNVTNPNTQATHKGWTPVMLSTLKSLGAMPDYLIYHRYPQNPQDQWNPGESDSGLLAGKDTARQTWADVAADLRGQLTDYLGDTNRSVELVVTENNSVSFNPGKQTTSLVDGLYLADSVGSLLQTEFNSLVWWTLHNGQIGTNNNSSTLYGWRQYGDYGMLASPGTPPVAGGSPTNTPYPTYYAMKLLSYWARGGDQVIKATSSNALLPTYAVKRADGTLGLLVVNKSPLSTCAAEFSISGFVPQWHAPVYTYGMAQDTAAQTGTGLADVTYASYSGAGALFSADFKPYTATVITLVPAETAASRLINISARAACGAGNNVTIGGLVVGGSGNKRVLLRAVGPTLATLGLSQSEVLADPTFDVHSGSTVIATNDNWGDYAPASDIATTGAQLGATPLVQTDTTSAATILSVAPGVYSFVASGKNSTAGIVLVEAYDADAATSTSTLMNISARAYCTTGNGVTIGGFVITGNAPKHLLLRAVGPSLTGQSIGATELLADPTIKVYHNGAVIATNDNWGDNADAALITSTATAIGAQALSSTDTASSALLLTLPPGVYSFIASGKNSTSGIVLIEVYDADAATGSTPYTPTGVGGS